MDKHEYRLKTEQMLKYVENQSYEEALEIAESIEWEKVKNVSVLCTVSEIYEYNGDYQKSRDILFMAYDRSPDSKKIIYRLGTLALKLGEIKEAMDCYEEFKALAPKDPNQYIFKYKILKSKNAPIEEQIAVLETFKQIEYVEKWAFELASLYKEAGMITECLEACDDLILWFSEGTYIYKAMEMKMQYKPLTPLQHEKYMNRPELKAQEEEVQKEEVQEEEVQEEVAIEAVQTEAAEVSVEEVQAESEEEMQKEDNAETATMQEASAEKVERHLSIEEIVQDWQEQQVENAQMIQAEIEKAELEKAKEVEEKEETEEEKEELLPDDVRRLMEELEAESAEIYASKTSEEVAAENEEPKPLFQKAVESISSLGAKIEFSLKETAVSEAITEAPLGEIEEIEEVEDEDEGIKLGDTQKVALSTKALANAAKVDVPVEGGEEEEPAEEMVPFSTNTEMNGEDSYDTGFVVTGRYELEAHSDVGLKAGLTEEQKKLFSYFVPVHGMSEQLVKVLQADRTCNSRYGTSRIGNILVVGRRGSGKTVLAVDIVKAIQKARRMKHGKVAIVKAEALNKKELPEIVEKLHGGALIIEKASRLKRKTIEDLCEIMEGQTGELLVVLEDERKPLDKMLAEYPNFKKKFTSRVELPVFINDELVTFGQTYAKENGYKIDEMGILALYSDIDTLQREEKIVTVADVKALIDDAIENSNRASLKKIVKKVLGRNKDESDRIILKEEDFR